MVRFHPQWLRARELVREGRIGTLRAVQMFFGYNNLDPANVRNKADIGGGGLYDIGCYAIVAGRFFLEAEPARGDRARSIATRRSAPIGSPARWSTSATAAGSISPCRRRSLRISGSSCAARKGRIEIHIPVNAPQGATTRISIDDCTSLEGTGIVTETLRRERPVPAAGRSVLARGARRDRAAVRHRGRDRQHARDRRACSARSGAGGGRTSAAGNARRRPVGRAYSPSGARQGPFTIQCGRGSRS